MWWGKDDACAEGGIPSSLKGRRKGWMGIQVTSSVYEQGIDGASALL